MDVVKRTAELKKKGFASKADLARALLTEGFSVGQVSKAVPMAYSQAHSIAKAMGKLASQDPVRREAVHYHTGRKVKPLPAPPITNRPTSKKRVEEAREWAAGRVEKGINALSRQSKTRTVVSTVSPFRASKQDKKLGACLNCGFELVAKTLGGQRQIVHEGMTPEEYIHKVQFCHAYPVSLT